jgi:hypothetical protein
VTPIRTAKGLSILHTYSPCRVAGPSLSIGQLYAPKDEAFHKLSACLTSALAIRYRRLSLHDCHHCHVLRVALPSTQSGPASSLEANQTFRLRPWLQDVHEALA